MGKTGLLLATTSASSNTETILADNLYLSSGQWKFINADEASYIYQNSGIIRFYTGTATGVSAGDNFTDTGAERMSLDSTGKLHLPSGSASIPQLELGSAGSIDGLMVSRDSLYLNIDSYGAHTDKFFQIGHNSQSASGATPLMRVEESGVKINVAGQDLYYAGDQVVGTSFEDVDTTAFPTFTQRNRAYLLYWVSYANHNGDMQSRQYGIAWISGNEHGSATNYRTAATILASNSSGYHGYANLSFQSGSDGILEVKRSSSSQQSYVLWWVQNACSTARV